MLELKRSSPQFIYDDLVVKDHLGSDKNLCAGVHAFCAKHCRHFTAVKRVEKARAFTNVGAPTRNVARRWRSYSSRRLGPMPRYFFDQNDSGFPRDHAGLEIDDPRELRREALRAATNDLSKRPIDEARSAAEVTVRDENGTAHLIVRVTVEKPDA